MKVEVILAQANKIDSDFHLAIGQRIQLTDTVSAATIQTSQTAVSSSGGTANLNKASPTIAPSVTPSSKNPLPIVWQWPINRNIVKNSGSVVSQLKGIDIPGSLGALVLAAAPGFVVFAGSGLRGYGNLVIIQHEGNYLSAYAYASEILVVEKQVVAAGDPVAKVGRQNVAANPALHFEIRKDGKPLNPLTLLPRE